MADTVYQKFDPGTQEWKTIKLHDNGDGTFSEQLYDAAGAAVSTVLGAKTDLPEDAVEDATARSLVSLLKSIANRLYTLVHTGMAVTGTFWQATQPVSINHTTPGTTDCVESRPNCRRNAGVLHRSAIAAVDKLTDFGDAGVTIANVAGTQGHLVFNTAYYMTAIPGNRWGCCKVNTNIDTLTVTNDAASTHVIACTIAQCVAADYYDLFLSTDAAPKWVARITEAQRATGCEVLALATISAGGSAGVVNVGAVGTGIQTTNAVFQQSNAYTPDAVGITAINCAGYSKAHVKVKVVLTDLRAAPICNIVPFFGNQVKASPKRSLCSMTWGNRWKGNWCST